MRPPHPSPPPLPPPPKRRQDAQDALGDAVPLALMPRDGAVPCETTIRVSDRMESGEWISDGPCLWGVLLEVGEKGEEENHLICFRGSLSLRQSHGRNPFLSVIEIGFHLCRCDDLVPQQDPLLGYPEIRQEGHEGVGGNLATLDGQTRPLGTGGDGLDFVQRLFRF